VWERDEVENAVLVSNGKGAANDFIEFFERQKLGNGEFADWDDQFGTQEIDLVIHPGRTVPDFVRRRNPIPARRRFAREATTDRGEVNFGANLLFIHAAELLEPAEQRPASCPREWFAEHRFFYAWRLANQHDFAEDWAARNWRRQHPRATPALKQSRDVGGERLLLARRAGHYELAPENRQQQRQDDADDDAGDDREVKGGIAAFDADVARKPAQPPGPEPRPKRDAGDHYHAAKNRQHSAHLPHFTK